MSFKPSSVSLLDQLVDSFMERKRRGERPSIDEYIQKHPELADQIREVFPALELMEEFGSAAGPGAGPSRSLEAGRLSVSSQLGEFRILGEVGRGGMGVVYQAVQESLGRQVALKVLPPQARDNPLYLERFRREAQSAARLHHTNIVPVFGVGEHEGVAYYAMQFIRGHTLEAVLHQLRRFREGEMPSPTRFLAGAAPSEVAQSLLTGRYELNLSAAKGATALLTTSTIDVRSGDSQASLHPSQRGQAQYFRNVAEVGVQVAEALAYAHGQGVIHRDIKPSNLMLDLQGTVWVTDFGLAKVEGSNELTQPGDLLGTLRYMAPEQFDGRADAGSDVYSLGVTLYELATLQPAFDDPLKARLIDRIRQHEPAALRQVDPALPRDLETIILKAMAKEPGRRYRSAAELAEDLQRFLADRPIWARRVGWLEHSWRWCRRNPALALLGSGLLLAVLVIVAGLLAGTWRLRSQFAQVVEEKDRAERALNERTEAQRREQQSWYHHRIGLAHYEWQNTNLARARELLEECPEAARSWEWHYLQRLCHLELSTARWHGGEVTGVAFSPDGGRLVTSSNDGSVQGLDVGTGEEQFRLEIPKGRACPMAYSPDGQRFATSFDGTVKVWDTGGKELLTLTTKRKGTMVVAFSPDGTLLAAAESSMASDPLKQDGITVWDARTGQVQAELGVGIIKYDVRAIAFSTDSRLLAAVRDNGLIVWDIRTGKEKARAEKSPSWFKCVAFSPDGNNLATGMSDGKVLLWDAVSLKEIHSLQGHGNEITSVAFSPGRASRLATSSADRMVKVWDWQAGKELFTYRGHTGAVLGLAYSPDGTRLASAGGDRTVKVWDARMSTEARTYPVTPVIEQEYTGDLRTLTLSHRLQGFLRVAYSPDHRLCAVPLMQHRQEELRGKRGRTMIIAGVRLLDLNTGQWLKWVVLGPTCTPAFSPDGQHLAISPPSGTGVMVWDIKAEKSVRTLASPSPLGLGLSFSPDGQRLAAGTSDFTIQVWDFAGGEVVQTLRGHTGHVRDIAISPDGRRVAATGADGTTRIWDLADGSELHCLRGHESEVACCAFSPDGRLLATGGRDARIKLWAVDSGEEMLAISGHRGEVWSVAFSPDGQRLASSGVERVSLWDTRSGQAILILNNRLDAFTDVAYSKDGKRILAAGYMEVKVWEAVPVQEGVPR